MPAPPFLAEPGYTPFDFSDAEDWKEAGPTGDNSPGGPDVFSKEKADAILVGQIPSSRRQQFRRDTMGYAYTDSTHKLYRVNPVRHPEIDDCHAVGISLHRKGIRGNDALISGGRTWPKLENPRPQGSIRYTTNYQLADATIRFGQIPYDVIDDADMFYLDGTTPLEEYWRNVDWAHDVKPEVSTLNSETDRQLIFAEGATPPLGTAFPGRAIEYVCKTSLAWRWYDVPEEYLFQGVDGEPVKIQEALGRVNSVDFAGYVAGTLLLLGVQLVKFQYPWRFFDPVYTTRSVPAFGYHVTFFVSQFDPTPAVATTTVPGTPLARGHNLQPYRTVVAGTKTRWYLATLGGGASDPRLIPGTDFKKLFENANV